MSRKIKVEEMLIADYQRKTRTIPQIRLKGKWLEAMGFKPGSYVTIKVYAPGCADIRVNAEKP